MLIWLDESVLEADLSLDTDACHGVSTIFDAVFRGEHYAISSRKTLSALVHSPYLSEATKRVVSTTLSNLTTIGAIADNVSRRLKITHGSGIEPVIKTDRTWEVSLRSVGINGLRKSVLLTENLNDAHIFVHAAQHYQVCNRIRGQVCLEKMLGGGSTTPDVLKNLVDVEKRLCICITDSDRLCPSDEMGATAKRCSMITMGSEAITDYVDLKVREIENVVPLVLLAEAVPSTHHSQWEWHMDRFFTLCPEAHRYCDMKLGVTRRVINSYPADGQRKIFWDSVVERLADASVLQAKCREGECQNSPNHQCECHVTYGFGENLLSVLVSYLESKSPHDLEKRTRNDPLREGWLEIGKRIYEWACAPKPIRS